MAVASFSFTAVVQDVFQLTETAQQQAPAVGTPVDANQAQNVPAPADTVTLTNQTAQGQQDGQGSNAGRFDRNAPLGIGLFLGANNDDANRQAQQPTLPVLLPQLQPQNALASTTNARATASPANAANTAATASTPVPLSDTANTPQQELQQLDQTLQQLGINPQSISIFNRMAMLLYASDPTALRLLVQTLQSAATQQDTGQAATNAPNGENQAVAQALLPAAQATGGQSSASAMANTRASAPAHVAPQIEAFAAEINFSGLHVAARTQLAQSEAGRPSANANVGSAAAPPNAPSFKIEELQRAFQEVQIHPGKQQANGASVSVAGGNLNVTF